MFIYRGQNKMKKITILIVLALLTSCWVGRLYATHIRAGEITCKLISATARLYEFKLTLYLDKKSSVDQLTALFNFGDGSLCEEKDSDPPVEYSSDIRIRTYRIQHAYASNGTYTIGFNGENRNANTKNINDGNSVSLSFYVETRIVIDPFLGINNSPTLQLPPIDKAAVGQVFIHNPGATDPDGDSIAYVSVAPQSFVGSTNINDCPTGFPSPVPRYRYPNDSFFGGTSELGGSPTYSINPITGQITWDTPAQPGQYNIAFKIEKFRKINGRYVSMGYVIRDMQILVEDTNNKRPKLSVPKDTCVIAGTKLDLLINAQDSDGHPITLTSFGDVYSLTNSPAEFKINVAQPQPSPAQGQFIWNTNCQHIREKRYQVTFKAEDKPPGSIPSLVDIRTWQIKVVGPPPKNLVAQPTGVKSIQLTWDTYTCTNAEKITIWRRSGSYAFNPSVCNTGIPDNAGFEKVGEVGVGITSFIDNSKGLKKGIQYCYRLVAEFPPAPETPFAPYVKSLASNEACAQLKLVSPVLTHVTVIKTNAAAGEMVIRWTKPLELDPIAFPGPYKYELYRGDGIQGTTNLLIATKTNLDDTVFNDKPLNTLKPYHYKVLLYSNNVLVDSSDVASSLFLTYEPPSCPPLLDIDSINCDTYIRTTPCENTTFKNTLTWNTLFDCSNQITNPKVTLTWNSNTPWINNLFSIYRQINGVGPFQLIGTSTQPRYDDPITSGNTYCYYVESKGSYSHSLLKDFPLFLNSSQELCTSQAGNAAGYDLYYADRSDDTLQMTLLKANIQTNTFIHEPIPHYAFCYAIKTVNAQGERSKFSNVVCNDNCPYYELPNIFTPNEDGLNDVLIPIKEPLEKCPRFVDNIEFEVYNRWGNKVYQSASQENNNSIYIKWDGKTSEGKRLETGIYYYSVKVKFIRLHGGEEPVFQKGWIHILR